MTKKSHYPQANQNLDFAKMEEEILRFWQAEKIFEKSGEIKNFGGFKEGNVISINEAWAIKSQVEFRQEKEEKPEFCFYYCPPFAN